MQYFDWIVELKYDKVERVCQIPNLPLDRYIRFLNRLFTIGDELFFPSQHKLYKLVNGKPEFQIKSRHF